MTELDARQRAAVDAGPVDLFVSAGAGSGKTRLLVARYVAAVLGEPPYPASDPRELVAVTFTEKAAGELVRRIRGELLRADASGPARDVERSWISTIHGLCGKILRENALAAGIDPRFTVLDDVQAGALAIAALEASYECLSSSGGTGFVRLIDAYTLVQLEKAVRHVYDRLRSGGWSVGDVGRFAEAARDRMGSLRGELLEVAARLEATGAATASARSAAQAATAVARLLEHADDESARSELACACEVHRLRKAGTGDVKALIGSVKDLLAEASALGAQLLVEPHEDALLGLVEAYDREYSRLKRERAALDFSDLEHMTAAMLRAHPDIAERYRSRFRMVMVDEFQDTSPLQLEIAELLSAGNLCTVGDVNQTIYGFRSADVRVYHGRADRVREHRTLDVNYRTHPDLLAAVNAVFSSPELLGEGLIRLVPGDREWKADAWPAEQPRMRAVLVHRGEGSSVRTSRIEAVADEVNRFLAAGIPPADVVVLLRTVRNVGDDYEAAFEARGIPAMLVSGGTFFGQTEIAEMTALLRAADNVLDDEAVALLLAGRLAGVSDDGLFRLRQAAGRGPLWSAVRRARELALGDGDLTAVVRVAHAIERMRATRGQRTLGELIVTAAEELDYDLVLFSQGSSGRHAWANVLKFARIAGEFEQQSVGDIGAFLEYLGLREQRAGAEGQAALAAEGVDAVRIMSIHAAKGLEFPYVVVGEIDGGDTRSSGPVSVVAHERRPVLGMQLCDDGGSTKRTTLGQRAVREIASQQEEAEATRLLYVACTRAERALTIVLGSDPAEAAREALSDRLRAALRIADPILTERTIEIDDDARVFVDVVEPEPIIAGPAPPGGSGRTPVPIGAGAVPDAIVEPVRSAPPRFLSYTALERHAACPYRFYVERVAGMRLPDVEEVAGTGARELGIAVHAALQLGGTEAEMAETVRRLLERRVSADVLARALEAVSGFAGSSVAAEIADADRVEREMPFTVALGAAVLSGSFDVYACSKDSALIVDYKTGSAPLSAAEARTRFELQAECYAYAALSTGIAEARVTFVELERACRTTTFHYDKDGLSGLGARLGARVEGIGARGYPPRTAYDPEACEACPALGGWCPVTRPRSAAG
ncbi:MAG: hypothetical protein Kow0067_09500 [Coriobacteriia bacterium]